MKDDDVEDAANSIAEMRIRRLPIIDEEKRLVGILSIGDIAFRHDGDVAGATLERVCAPEGAQATA